MLPHSREKSFMFQVCNATSNYIYSQIAFARRQQKGISVFELSCHLPTECQAGKLLISIFIVFGLARPGIEPQSTVSVADALFTRPQEDIAIQKIAARKMEPKPRLYSNSFNPQLHRGSFLLIGTTDACVACSFVFTRPFSN